MISLSEDPECKKESSSSPLAVSLTVSEKGNEVDERVDTVDSESILSIEMEHDSGTDHQEEAANEKDDPAIENLAVDSSCSDIATSSPSAPTESKPSTEKGDSDTEMIDTQWIQKDGGITTFFMALENHWRGSF